MTAQLDQRVPLPSLCRRRVWLVLKPTLLLVSLAVAIMVVRWVRLLPLSSENGPESTNVSQLVGQPPTHAGDDEHSIPSSVQRALLDERQHTPWLSQQDATTESVDTEDISRISSSTSREPHRSQFQALIDTCSENMSPLQCSAIAQKLADESADEVEHIVSVYVTQELSDNQRVVLRQAIALLSPESAEHLATFLASPELTVSQRRQVYEACHSLDERAVPLVPVLRKILEAKKDRSDWRLILRFLGKLDSSEYSLGVIRSALSPKSDATYDALAGTKYFGAKAEPLIPLIAPYLDEQDLVYPALDALCGIGTPLAMKYATPKVEEWLETVTIGAIVTLQKHPELARDYQDRIRQILHHDEMSLTRIVAAEVLLEVNLTRYRSDIYSTLQSIYLRVDGYERGRIRSVFERLGYAPVHPLYQEGAKCDSEYRETVRALVAHAVEGNADAVVSLKAIDDFDHPYFLELPLALTFESPLDETVADSMRTLGVSDRAPPDVRLAAFRVLSRNERLYEKDIDSMRNFAGVLRTHNPEFVSDMESILNRAVKLVKE